jgi:hypothetical protein
MCEACDNGNDAASKSSERRKALLQRNLTCMQSKSSAIPPANNQIRNIVLVIFAKANNMAADPVIASTQTP